ETAYRRRRTPIGTAQARGRVSGGSAAFGRRRSAGLSAHDAIEHGAKNSGADHDSGPSQINRCDVTAPDHRKMEPAYAHSLSTGNPGAAIAAAAPTCHAPKMSARYAGYPRWRNWTTFHSIGLRFHTDPATNSNTIMNVVIQKAMVRIRIRFQFQRRRERVA